MKPSILILLLLSLSTANVSAETAEEKGLAIAVEADRRDLGYGDYTANMTMTLRNRHGQESVRAIRFQALEVEGDGDKSITVFDNPRDVKGTSFLSYSHKQDDDDRWLYLPALKRVKRISSGNKSGSFMGSEFAYEDISSQEVEKYTYKWLRNEVYDGRDCFVVEYYPVDRKNSGYSRQVNWLDKQEYRVWKVEYYDRKNSHLKTLTITGYELYMDSYWRAAEYNMVNHQNGKSTLLQLDDYQFATGLTDADFSRNALKRMR